MCVGEKEHKYNSLGELTPNTGCLQVLTGTALVLPLLLEEASNKIQNTWGGHRNFVVLSLKNEPEATVVLDSYVIKLWESAERYPDIVSFPFL